MAILGNCLRFGARDLYTLPQNLNANPAWQPMPARLGDNLTGWGGSSATVTANTTEYKCHNKSMKVTATVAGTRAQADYSGAFPFEFSTTYPQSYIWVYAHSDLATYADASIYIDKSAGAFTKYFQMEILPYLVKDTWVKIDVSTNNPNWVSYGGATWAMATGALRLRHKPTAGNLTAISYDGWEAWSENANRYPAAVFVFDDAYASMYSIVYPMFKALGNVPGTIYAVTNWIGTAGYCTAEQLTEMYVAGWDIGNHTANHLHVNGLTQAAVEAELTEAQTDLEALGFYRASQHVAYPFGENDAEVQAAMDATGMLTGATIVEGLFTLPPADYHALTRKQLSSTVTLAQAKGYIDGVVTTPKVVIYLLHDIVPGVPAGYEWNEDDLSDLLDYAVQNQVHLLQISDIYRLCSGSIIKPRQRNIYMPY